ncbi:Oligosaccaryltransferase domain-containing protein [Neurospora intermedia]|uniref:Dolichyl-diphosphooligosaccharide--protein glycosyltransferase subunit 4 n=1 Tax=Neurospora intermedia TaxID=5142 RepID=A0ABR3DDD3_NEUIN
MNRWRCTDTSIDAASRPSRWKAVHNTRQSASSLSNLRSSRRRTASAIGITKKNVASRNKSTATSCNTERIPDRDFSYANDTMISDAELYRLAIVLGCAAMVLIVLHHFLETNAEDLETDVVQEKKATKVAAAPTKAK